MELIAVVAPASSNSPYGHWMGDSAPNISFVYTASQDHLPSSAVPPNAPFGKPIFKDRTARGDREHTFMLGFNFVFLLYILAVTRANASNMDSYACMYSTKANISTSKLLLKDDQ